MPDFNQWLTEGGPEGTPAPSLTASRRAALAWRRIQEKPTSVSFRTRTGVLAPQSVRLESDSQTRPAQSAAGLAPARRVVIFGVRDHDTVSDTDIAEGYRFVYLDDEYTVLDVILTLGEVQGMAEAIG